jgi:predicted DNA-binding transcriptional regulator YafY
MKKYSDKSAPLKQYMIMDYLYEDHGMSVDRKAVKRNLDALEALGYPLRYKKTFSRKDNNGEESTVYTDWYLERDITDAELHLLIDSLLSSKYISHSQCEKLAGKLKKMGSAEFRETPYLPESQPENSQLLDSVGKINMAIKKQAQVSFQIVTYGADGKLHTMLDGKGAPRIYRVNPYEIVVTNGRYYLICSHSKGDTLFHYRLDTMRETALIEKKLKNMTKHKVYETRRPLTDLAGYTKPYLNLSEYMKGRIYMYGGAVEKVTFRADKAIISHVVDWFGKDVRFAPDMRNGKESESTVKITVTVNLQSMLYWALQFGQSVEILEPEGLRGQVKAAVEKMCEKYST